MPKPHSEDTKRRARQLYEQRGARHAAETIGVSLRTIQLWARSEGWARRLSPHPTDRERNHAQAQLGWAIRKRGLADEAGAAAAEALEMFRERVKARKVYGARDLAVAFASLTERADAMSAGLGGLDGPQVPGELRMARLRELAGALEQRRDAAGG
jgi:hypothetical protein